MFFFCIKNRIPIRREPSYTIHSLREGFLYQLKVQKFKKIGGPHRFFRPSTKSIYWLRLGNFVYNIGNLFHATSVCFTLRKKCYWIKSISFQKHVYHGFKSICYRISNMFIASCSIFLWINSVHAFGKKCFWFNSIFFSVHHLYFL